ncbi:MAG: UDP-3-O-(3-hydroxymyristoyl)glucosamine N-acyltransferase [Chthoniobacterales bacterium]|nr:UDP-3-O-(3-hydroxymyristoyl)glucosamine N-acyltransferase [Chthoniobacterales bacterium]
MTFTLQELATLAGGELRGESSLIITGAASLPEATDGEITFYGNPKYMPQLRRTRASAVFVPADFAEEIGPAQIRVVNPAKAFEQVVLKLAPPPIQFAPGIHASSVIAADVKLGERVSIQPHVVIEAGATIGSDSVIGANSYIGHGSSIGAACVIYPQVTIRERTRIGDRVIIHSGAVLGADGFGFEISESRHTKVPQIGIVQIDDDVEIGANTTIDRARFGRTWIKEGAKIDNLVQIAHNVIVGRHSIIAAQTGVAGSSRVGDYVMMGGKVGVAGHVEIGDRNILGASTGVSKDLPPDGGTWWGTVAVPLREAKQQLAWVHRLGQLFARVKAIEKKLGL